MGFRWIALVALWTLLSGPIFSKPTYPAPVVKKKMNRQAVKEVRAAHAASLRAE